MGLARGCFVDIAGVHARRIAGDCRARRGGAGGVWHLESRPDLAFGRIDLRDSMCPDALGCCEPSPQIGEEKKKGGL
jgi:hypothetical protein